MMATVKRSVLYLLISPIHIKMTTQFVFDVMPNTYGIRQVLPLHFKDRYFNGQKWVYLINNNRIRHKVRMGLVSGNQLELYDTEWERFVEDSGYQNLATLHFIHESADTFYVTGYEISGWESGGYDELRTRGRMTRCFSRLGQNITQTPLLAGDFIPYIELDAFTVTVNGNIFTVTRRRELIPGSHVNYGNVFFGNGWDDLVYMLHLKPGIPMVFTNVGANTIAMMVFATDGWELTHETLGRTNLAFLQPIRAGENDPRMLQICRWAGHGRHFDESKTFYRALIPNVIDKGLLTIPAKFVTKHELYTYDHAILHHRGAEYKVRLYLVRHRKKPHLKNHVIMKGKWKVISRECGFARNKMVRFKYVADVEDEEQLQQGDSPVMMPMFDIC